MSLTSLMRQRVAVSNVSGFSEYGRETYGTPAYIFARVQLTTRQRWDPSGKPVTIAMVAYLPKDTVVAVQDKISYQGVAYRVFGLAEAIGGDGQVSHIKVECIKWKVV